MANYKVDTKTFGLKKETTRGTAEAAPNKWLMLGRDSELDFSLEQIENDRLAIQADAPFVPEAGRKVGKGKLVFDLEAQTIGETLNSLLGAYSGTQVGTSTAYTHTFSKTTSTQHPSYSLFMDRGVEAEAYSLAVCKAINLTMDSKGKGQVTAEWLFKNESSTTALATTGFSTPDPLMFYHSTVVIDTTDVSARVGAFNMKIDNMADALWLYNTSQLCADIVVGKKMEITGGFDMYFTSTAERADFLANTSRKLTFNIIGDLITGSSYYRMLTTLYNCKYNAVPFDSELEGGLLGASMAFKAYYSISDGKAMDIVIGNQTTTY